MDSSDDDEPESLQYKVILLGDGTVGKTSIAMRFTDDEFAKSYKQTIGVDFFIKRLSLPSAVNVAVQLWDIGGQTMGGKMVGNYIFGSHAVLLVYDITNYQSFQSLEDWFALVKQTFKDKPMPLIALIANKADMTHLRVVKPEQHNNWAKEHDMYSYFVSAKTGDNVHSTFFRIAADLAGVALEKTDLEVLAKPVTAEIVDHPTRDAHHGESAPGMPAAASAGAGARPGAAAAQGGAGKAGAGTHSMLGRAGGAAAAAGGGRPDPPPIKQSCTIQ